MRGRDGDTRVLPARRERAPRRDPRRLAGSGPDAPQAQAEEIATKLLDALGYVGVLAVELFDVGGTLLANEFAPRVHNTGHWTIDGAVTSQFENHVRAVLGWPLGSTEALGESVMVNLVGGPPPCDPGGVYLWEEACGTRLVLADVRPHQDGSLVELVSARGREELLRGARSPGASASQAHDLRSQCAHREAPK